MKKAITTITLAAILGLGSTFANAGIIVAGRSADQGCTASTEKDGIIVAGRDGIIVAGIVGIIVAGLADTTPSTCDDQTARDGIIVAG